MKRFFQTLRQPCTISVNFSEECRKTPKSIEVNDPHDQFVQGPTNLQVFSDDDEVSGTVNITPEKKFEHAGIKIELVGEIIIYQDTREVCDFLSLSKELASPAIMDTVGEVQSFPFQFSKVDKPFESYRGIHADVRYYLRIIVNKSMGKQVHEQEFWVQNLSPIPEKNRGVVMEVGVDRAVTMKIHWSKTKLACNEVINGKLEFKDVKAGIDKAVVSIIKKETVGSGFDERTESETLESFEVIDGSPIAQEIVPVRLYLPAIEEWKLTQSYANVDNKFSVRYVLHLSLHEKHRPEQRHNRKYFKQQEIELYRPRL
eukprot:gb/GECH01009526.1/.p1 GENE.gb/GECH01009526.1/~~gb/GECH01009526.1/.p1  ORF type:complete len:315 (+),score=63.41 gb/GECH01009526.1/:1-945(+)